MPSVLQITSVPRGFAAAVSRGEWPALPVSHHGCRELCRMCARDSAAVLAKPLQKLYLEGALMRACIIESFLCRLWAGRYREFTRMHAL